MVAASLPSSSSSSSSVSRMNVRSSLVSTSPGGRSRSASVRMAVLSRPMVAAAPTPCPTTSPPTRASRPPGSPMTSNQSPPTPSSALAGR